MARFLLLPLLFAAGCSSAPPLLFPLEDSDSGRLDRITLWSQPGQVRRWELTRTQGSLGPDGLSSHLVYGSVPAGMRQAFPVDDQPPAPLDDAPYLLAKTEYRPPPGSDATSTPPPVLRWFAKTSGGYKEVEDPGPTFKPTPPPVPRHHKGH